MMPRRNVLWRLLPLFLILPAQIAVAGTSPEAPEETAREESVGNRAVEGSAAGWQVRGQLTLRAELLGRAGLEVEGAEESRRPEGEVLARFAGRLGEALHFRSRGSVLRHFEESRLRLSSALELSWAGGTAAFEGGELTAASASLAFELLDSTGSPVLAVEQLHVRLAGDRLIVSTGDLRLTRDLARRLGRPALEGLVVGSLELTAAVGRGVETGLAGGPEPCPEPVWGPGVDIELTDVDSVGLGVREAGSSLTVLPSARLRNVGPAAVPWYARLSGEFPPHDNDQHPFLVWNLYRLVDGRMEQIGRSWVKHAFFTVNSDCTPPYDSCFHPNFNQILWPGCRDVYGERTNSRFSFLAPREEVNPLTGEWDSCGSTFDGDCDGELDDDTPQSSFDRQMVVQESALEVPGAEYVLEAWYLVRDDVDPFNSMGHVFIDPQEDGQLYLFPIVSGFSQGPAIDAWVDPGQPEPGARSTLRDGPGGRLKLAVRWSQLPNGRYRYDYALMNVDHADGLVTFRLPLAPEAPVFSSAFHDADDQLGNQWPTERTEAELRWTAPAGNALTWGTVYSFSIETTKAPREAAVLLRTAEGKTLQIKTTAPAPDLEVLALPALDAGAGPAAGAG